MGSKWIAMYSHTGREVQELAQELGVSPDVILTDNQDNINGHDPLSHEAAMELLREWDTPVLVTLHGYMGLIPLDVISNPNLVIYNGHPALITMYPELVGKDPQVRAHAGVVAEQYKVVGSVIHLVTPELDGGPVVLTNQFVIPDNKIDLPEFIDFMHTMSVDLWIEFLTALGMGG